MLALATTDDRAVGATPRELRCRRRACDALLARVVGATLACLDGTRVGPVAPGMVVARKCPKCGHRNLFWL
jgi:phage FluMu protein Com